MDYTIEKYGPGWRLQVCGLNRYYRKKIEALKVVAQLGIHLSLEDTSLIRGL